VRSSEEPSGRQRWDDLDARLDQVEAVEELELVELRPDAVLPGRGVDEQPLSIPSSCLTVFWSTLPTGM
jgi:hypothetical protein